MSERAAHSVSKCPWLAKFEEARGGSEEEAGRLPFGLGGYCIAPLCALPRCYVIDDPVNLKINLEACLDDVGVALFSCSIKLGVDVIQNDLGIRIQIPT